ncbi:MAG TPA: MarC family protein [Methylomirabilota bacterium]|jgi:multiple antibiotic resistance protein|nr:MarC family protein [Methylomirabilota bacterium]
MTETLFTTFVTFFIIIDPLGIAPLFLSLTHDSTEALRRQVALKATGIAAGVLLVFAVSGDVFLRSLGITLPALRIAGGALLFLLSIEMVFARSSGLRTTTAGEEAEAAHKADIAVFPLAIPLIAGPGAITSTVLLMGRHSGAPAHQLAVMAVLLVVLALNLGVLLAASRFMRVLGVTGVNVVTRVFGIILAALAVQFMLDGFTVSFPGGSNSIEHGQHRALPNRAALDCGDKAATEELLQGRTPRGLSSLTASEPCNLLLKLFDFRQQIEHNADTDPIHPQIAAQAHDPVQAQDRCHVKQRLWRCGNRIDQTEGHQSLDQDRVHIRQARHLT